MASAAWSSRERNEELRPLARAQRSQKINGDFSLQDWVPGHQPQAAGAVACAAWRSGQNGASLPRKAGAAGAGLEPTRARHHSPGCRHDYPLAPPWPQAQGHVRRRRLQVTPPALLATTAGLDARIACHGRWPRQLPTAPQPTLWCGRERLCHGGGCLRGGGVAGRTQSSRRRCSQLGLQCGQGRI